MKQRSQALFPIGVLTLLAALTFWLDHAIRPPEAAKSGMNRHDPDYIVEDFTLRRFDLTGTLQHTLRAVKLVHYPDDDTTVLDDPYVIFTGRTEPSQVKADRAFVGPKGKKVVLVGNVVVTQDAAGGEAPTVLKTSVLTVLPDDQIARTTAPVTITQGKSVMHGVGLESNNITRVVTLLHDVTGTIQPQNNPPASP